MKKNGQVEIEKILRKKTQTVSIKTNCPGFLIRKGFNFFWKKWQSRAIIELRLYRYQIRLISQKLIIDKNEKMAKSSQAQVSALNLNFYRYQIRLIS
jgi:hypothetical protein